jgi:hypothetical protein
MSGSGSLVINAVFILIDVERTRPIVYQSILIKSSYFTQESLKI